MKYVNFKKYMFEIKYKLKTLMLMRNLRIPYILIEEHLKRCNLNFVLIKRGPNA